MPAAYDKYDYPAYWEGREYEHGAEIIAISNLLSKIKKVKNIIEIGGGYGRLIKSYNFRGDKIYVCDPSGALLKIARLTYPSKKYKFIHSNLGNLPKKVRSKYFDLAIMVRVLHHIKDLDKAFKSVHKIIKPNGYFILEFANKKHFKEVFKELAKGNFTFPFEIDPKDKRSAKNIRKKTLPFLNYNPDFIVEKLEKNGFIVIDKLSVSNIRSSTFKDHLSINNLLFFEKHLQKPLSYLNFGPSIFLLVKKGV